jgi:hypothetical protein
MPPTIEDPKVLDEIRAAMKEKGVGEKFYVSLIFQNLIERLLFEPASWGD